MFKHFLTEKRPVYIISAISAVVITFVFMLLFSAFVYFFNIDRSFIPFMSTLAATIGCFFASFFAARHICEKGYLIGLITGGTAFVIITVISFIAGNGGITLNTLFHFLIILLASVIGGIIGVNSGGHKII